MAVIPPWIDVKPSDFVNAAQGGARIGAELAGQANERNIAAQRNATALQEAQMRDATERALEGARAGQVQKQQEAERALREWEIRQQMIHNQSVIDAENQRSGNVIAGENQRAANALTERQTYGNSMLDIRREANRIAQERADAAKAKPGTGDFETVTEHTKEKPPAKSYDITEPGRFNLFSANDPEKSITTTNAADLNNLPRGSSIVTNNIPGTGSPAMTFSRRVPVGQNPYALQLGGGAPVAAPANPLEGKLVRHKDTGQTGVITNGVFVPDAPPDDGAANAD